MTKGNYKIYQDHALKIFGVFVIFAFCYGLFVVPIYAENNPTVYLGTATSAYGLNSEFTVSVFIDSDKAVNAFDIEIAYPTETLEFVSFNNGDSIVDFWRGNPDASEPGIIKMQGGNSKPWSGRLGEIVKINFRTKTAGLGQMFFRKTNVYYADGLGTLAAVTPLVLNLEISKDITPSSLVQVGDKNQPLILVAEIAKNPVDNSNLAIFNVADKESGVKAVYLRSRKWVFWDDWRAVSNPVRLTAGIWALEIKAVDNQGNEASKTLYVWSELGLKLLLFALAMAAIYYAVKFIIREKNVIIKS